MHVIVASAPKRENDVPHKDFMSDIINWCNTNSGFVMASLTAVYVVATLAIAMIASRSNRLAQENIKTLTQLEQERSRPIVVAELILDISFVSLRVRNVGQTSAYDIVFNLTPKLMVTLGGEQMVPSERTERPLSIIDKGIASLAPSSTAEAIIGPLSRLKEVYPALCFKGTVSYHGVFGKSYNDPITLDMSHADGALHMDRKTIHDVAKRLEEIKTEIHYIGSGFLKPQVLTQDVNDYRREQEEFIRQSIEHKKA